MKPFALVVLGLSPTGLYVVREAAATGLPVYGFSDRPESGAWSRCLANRGRPRTVAMADLVTRIGMLAGQFQRIGVIPTTDRHVEFLVENAERLPENLFMAGAYRTGVALRCLDKQDAQWAAQSCGLSLPWSHDLATGMPPAQSIPFPVLLKPRSIHHQMSWMRGRKLFVCRDGSELARRLDMARLVPEEWVLQALVPGPESAIRVAACLRRSDTGDLYICTARKLRQFPPNVGSASLVVTSHEPDVAGAARMLLEALDFDGIAGVEFKRESGSGTLRFIEANPRPCLWFGAVGTKGCQLVARQLRAWVPRSERKSDSGTELPVVWRYAVKDACSALSHRLRAGDGVFPPPAIDLPRPRSNAWALYRRDDPLPAAMEALGYLGKAWNRWRR